ncbi:MAG: 4Fe-4S dicluster domain-containing protein [Ruminococcaceae bacterium]|nr:4Fe-4S dicluster domain-containing protein [Oscillospiraceae bacterium]
MNKNFGFGCMRLPTVNDDIDHSAFSQMVDAFMDAGFNYFDTAHGYHGGKSETALRECLVKRYPRESFELCDKLSTNFFEKEEEIDPFFCNQLEWCGVDYFDYYLLHAQDRNLYEKYMRCNAYEHVKKFKEQGRVKHIGISFHDKADVLEKILTEHPEIEIVQIQFNYVDYEDQSVESRKVYEVCRKFNKPVIVMEPVRGGSLVRLPDEAKRVFDALNGGSYASYAIRFAAGFEGVVMVLSGMSDLSMVKDNTAYMSDFKPLDEAEREAVDKVCSILTEKDLIPCTACNYCVDSCPMNIPIPDFFSCLNGKKRFNTWNANYYYGIYTKKGAKASDCIECGACEELCPQHLKIRDLLKDVAKEFEEK